LFTTTAGGAFVIVVGVAAWVPFLALVAGLALTDGSYWSLVFLLGGFVVA